MRAGPIWIRTLGSLVLTDLRHRYAGSWFGWAWALLGPLVEVAAYAALFGLLLKPAHGLAYAVFVASGLLPWAAFREAVETSASVLADNRWIRRSPVPMQLLVARSVLVAAPRAAIAVAIVLAASLASSSRPDVASLLWPAGALVLQVVAAYGAGLAMAPLGTLYPDARPALTSVLTLLTFASPILYPESAVGPTALSLLEYNPFTHLLRLYRAPLAPQLLAAGTDVAWAAAAALLLVIVGRALQRRLWWPARDAL